MRTRCSLLLTLLTASGLSTAQSLDGSWRGRVDRAGQEIRYEVVLGHSQGRLIGRWSADAVGSSSGCLLGVTASNAGRFRMCTTDGSAGSRYLQELCPDYHPNQSRFVLKGPKLAWETWSTPRQSWRLFVLLERAEASAPLAWNREECGNP